jgi:hypothetical protein
MQPYVIKQGESLATLCRRDGFAPDDVWGDSTNADLRALRDDPMVFAPCDVIYLPDPPTPDATISLQSGADNNFAAAPSEPLYARLRLVDDSGSPIAGQAFVVDDGSDSPPQGTTDADGNADLELPYGQTSVVIHLTDSDLDLTVQVAYLDPITEASGLQQRLTALGLLPTLPAISDPDAASIVAQEYVAAALQTFQQQNGLDQTGIMDDATQQALLTAHGA